MHADHGAADPGATEPPVVLSVVVTVVDGGTVLEACLQALADQLNPPPMEVLVPFDDSVGGVDRLAKRFPGVRFIDTGAARAAKPPDGPAGQHELIDRRRTAGLAASRGELVAILEDRGIPARSWTRAVYDAHRAPNSVIGGVVENGVDRPLNWAVFFCDFGRYQLPLRQGPSPWITDVNVSYKREALERTRHLWKERYHETTVHWALRRDGDTLLLVPDMIVTQMRLDLKLGPLLAERFHWGRLFAHTRAREHGRIRLSLLTAGSILLPPLLFFRLAAHQARRRRRRRAFVVAAPATALLLIAWSAGEMVGYFTRKP